MTSASTSGTKTFLGEIWFLAGATTGIPTYVFMAFQMMFAIITVALISGAHLRPDEVRRLAGLRVRLGHPGLLPGRALGLGRRLHRRQHRRAGLRRWYRGAHQRRCGGARRWRWCSASGIGWPKESFKPHNVPFVALGAGLLWFGWFGFNAGSELTADAVTGVAFINTQVATAAALLGWIIVEWIRDGKPTLVGASSGAVAGLVAITPACGFITPRRGGAARPRRRCASAPSRSA